MKVAFRVDGMAKPQGSKKAFVVGGRAIIADVSRDMNVWRQRVATEAQRAMEGKDLICRGWPVEVLLDFSMPRTKELDRPKYKDNPKPHTSRPDIDKLARAVLDALTGICFEDDSQVFHLDVTKDYARPGEAPGVNVEVRA
jgi:crossover junction endodeoxyribonuclease RusA